METEKPIKESQWGLWIAMLGVMGLGWVMMGAPGDITGRVIGDNAFGEMCGEGTSWDDKKFLCVRVACTCASPKSDCGSIEAWNNRVTEKACPKDIAEACAHLTTTSQKTPKRVSHLDTVGCKILQ